MSSEMLGIVAEHCFFTTLEFASEALRFEGPRKPDPA